MSEEGEQVKPILGVTKSFGDRTWLENLDVRQQIQATAIAQQHGLPDIIGRILASRNIDLEDVPGFMDPKVKNLMPDPSILRDMDCACERVVTAIKNKEKIAIFGDYDVDGATSAALIARFLRIVGTEFEVHIPDRIVEGYGPNVEIVRRFSEQGSKLLITVDCGSTSFEAFEEARKIGLDVIVVDHHQVGEKLPETVGLINPNRQDDLTGVEYLAAVGVTYLFVVALNRLLRESGFYGKKGPPDLREWLDLVALGTVCDVVPIRGLNRAYINTGLLNIHRRKNAGIKALCDISGLNGPATTFHLGFMLGPKINAGGRIGDAGLGARLLLTEDATMAREIAEQLDSLNRQRKDLEAHAQSEAEVMVLQQLDSDPDVPVLILGSSNWHQGIIGLIAARIKDAYRRPTIAISFDKNDIGTASGRSLEGIDLGACVRKAVEQSLLLKGGGHAMAAGLTIERNKLDEFRKFIIEELGERVNEINRNRTLPIDATVAASGATVKLLETLERAGPYGNGHKEPVFALPAHHLEYAEIVGNGHVRTTIAGSDGWKLNGIAFRSADKPLGQSLLKERGAVLHFAGSLSINHWQGNKKAQLRIIDAADPKNVTRQ